MRHKSIGRVSIITIPWKTLVYRFFVLLMIAASVALLVASKTNDGFVKKFRMGMTDIVVPIIETLATPVDAVQHGLAWARDIATVRTENEQLKQENAKLMRWQYVATELENENNRLRDLLQFAPSNKESYTSARVAIDNTGPYVKAVTINAGHQSGVEPDLAVINENGLVGRVIDTGERSARVLLLTDINSRVPVMSETSRERSIASGDNSDMLSLKYLSQDSKISVGERIVTTSDGGVMPPGLPVGVVTEVSKGVVKVRPYVDWFRLEYVSVVDFSM